MISYGGQAASSVTYDLLLLLLTPIQVPCPAQSILNDNYLQMNKEGREIFAVATEIQHTLRHTYSTDLINVSTTENLIENNDVETVRGPPYRSNIIILDCMQLHRCTQIQCTCILPIALDSMRVSSVVRRK